MRDRIDLDNVGSVLDVEVDPISQKEMESLDLGIMQSRHQRLLHFHLVNQPDNLSIGHQLEHLQEAMKFQTKAKKALRTVYQNALSRLTKD